MRNCLSVTAKPHTTISRAVCRSSCVSTWIDDLSYERYMSRQLAYTFIEQNYYLNLAESVSFHKACVKTSIINFSKSL
ncbi:hypothetical protein VIGAN_08099300 [Vigna angularis var. angularis]|uniref:Uncharacterized protein n=1 Tax=Vigna angularis var. angularis TaxID=157739 RepID=A0A0S3SNM1_PHAAN|nr:hypothetical protein VIGAN_08099300 [Vigna angularis var. angularis]